MKSSSFENPNYEEYWPDINGLAQREKITDETMPSNTFFDIAVIHILTTSTINRLRELYPQVRFEVRRFRPNIVIESGAKEMKNDFIENTWVGKKMIIGKNVVPECNSTMYQMRNDYSTTRGPTPRFRHIEDCS